MILAMSRPHPLPTELLLFARDGWFAVAPKLSPRGMLDSPTELFHDNDSFHDLKDFASPSSLRSHVVVSQIGPWRLTS